MLSPLLIVQQKQLVSAVQQSALQSHVCPWHVQAASAVSGWRRYLNGATVSAEAPTAMRTRKPWRDVRDSSADMTDLVTSVMEKAPFG